MKGLKSLVSLESLADQYDCFIFDIYGVIYDGASLLQKTIDFIGHLRKMQKAICFLSNSQRHSPLVLEELGACGFSLDKKEEAFTSGDYFRGFLKSNPEFKTQHLFYTLGEPKHLGDEGLKFTTDSKQASCIIFTLSTTNPEELNDYDSEIQVAFDHGCTSICINPDITAPNAEKIIYTPGYFAKKYEDLGGKVRYFGKPHREIYDFFIGDFLNKKKINKEKTLAIGDSINTDIKGAIAFGVDSLLLSSKRKETQGSLNENSQIVPTYHFQI